MEILTAIHTDVGIKKQTNEDSLCLKIAKTSFGNIVMAVICDGMGGLSKGELASASVIKVFSEWFENELPIMLKNHECNKIESRWESIIKEQNQIIGEYGNDMRIQLGTTLTVMLLIDKQYIIGHVGDSRVYRIDEQLQVITKDQTFVAREVERGTMTLAQSEFDPRRNVLLQCIGASKIVEPVFIKGTTNLNCVWMVCSDGFRHKITAKEIYEAFNPNVLTNEDVMLQKAKELVDINKSRSETDNITVLVMKLQ